MKQTRMLLTILVSIIIISCNEDKKIPVENLKKETISAKWNTSTPNDYVSFEFNMDGNYIAVKETETKSTDNRNIFFGTYTIIDNATISLSDLGTLEVIEVNDNSMNFIINGNNETIINASKQKEIETSDNTKLLCRTWNLVSLDDNEISNFIVLFSGAGTYFVDAVVEGEQITSLGTWTWCNSDENKLAFTIEDELDCNGIQIFKEIQLTQNSFTAIDMENGKPQAVKMEAN